MEEVAMTHEIPGVDPRHEVEHWLLFEEKREPINMPEVDPSELWAEVPLRRALEGWEGADLINTLRRAAIPTRHRDTKRGGLLRTLLAGKPTMVPEVPQRFLKEATTIADEFLREIDAG
jgi:hypothetical protein